MRPARGPDDFTVLGDLAPVAVAEERRGNRAVLETSEIHLRGYPPYATLISALDPDVVERDFELGWLIAWWPRAYKLWDLLEVVGHTSLSPQATFWGPFTRYSRKDADLEGLPRRVGWMADHPELALSRTESMSTRVLVSAPGGADQLVERVEQVDALLPDPFGPTEVAMPAWPDWFEAALAEPRGDVDWRHWHRRLRHLDPAERHRAQQRSTWTRARWELAVLPGERTWLLTDVARAGTQQVRVEVTSRHGGVPVQSLKRLLGAAGATGCTVEDPPKRVE